MGRAISRIISALKDQFNYNIFRFIKPLVSYLIDYRKIKAGTDKNIYSLKLRHFYPCLTDKVTHTPFEPIYFYQDAWAAEKIAAMAPDRHFDVGSSLKTMSIISRFFPVTMVDIRPAKVDIDDLTFICGSILNLPFKDNSIESLSCLCVVEHIGLGRYGDTINPRGSEEALHELVRILKPGGNLLFSLPVDVECRIYFNAHRAFTRDYILSHFSRLTLMEEKYIYGDSLKSGYDIDAGFGTGLFHFKK